MVDPDDFALHTGPRQQPPPDDSNRLWLWIGIAAAAVIVAGVLFWLFRPEPPAPEPAMTEAAAPADTTEAVAPEPEEPLVLPPLAESDTLVRTLVEGLSSRPELAAWLATPELIRNAAVVVDNIAEGVTPTKHLKEFEPTQPFRADETADTITVDPRSYARYDAFADAVASLDTVGTVETYKKLRPLFDDAYKELGHPDGNFDVALQRAISRLLATPDVPANVTLTPHVRSYHYADPQLEDLSAAQKQLVRMGPRNEKLVKDKLREILNALGFEERMD
jgi:hypothetical protein